MTTPFTPAMASRIELWPLDRLKPYAKNARTHSDAQVAQIASSIVEYGFTAPLLVSGDGGILAGLDMVAWPLRRNSRSTSCRWSSWITSRPLSAAPTSWRITNWRCRPDGMKSCWLPNWPSCLPPGSTWR